MYFWRWRFGKQRHKIRFRHHLPSLPQAPLVGNGLAPPVVDGHGASDHIDIALINVPSAPPSTGGPAPLVAVDRRAGEENAPGIDAEVATAEYDMFDEVGLQPKPQNKELEIGSSRRGGKGREVSQESVISK